MIASYLQGICPFVKAKTTFILIIATFLGLLVLPSCRESVPESKVVMEDQLNSQLQVLIDSCWNRQNSESFEKLASENFTRNLNGISVVKNPTEMEAHMKVFFTAFPDLEVSVEDSDIKGNKIFLFWQSTGTNTGVFGEVAATGKKVKINGLSHLYFDESGKLYREDVYYNELDLLQQLGYSLTPPNFE